MPPRRTPPPLRGAGRRPPPPIPVGRATLTTTLDPHAPNTIIAVGEWDGRGTVPQMRDGSPGYICCIVGKCLAVQRPATHLLRHPGRALLWPYCRDHVWPYRPRKAKGER